jgi:hypothetical protein
MVAIFGGSLNYIMNKNSISVDLVRQFDIVYIKWDNNRMKSQLVSPYRKAEKNCGDRLKILLLQVYDMSDRHNLQIYEMESVIKTIIDQVYARTKDVTKTKSKKAPAENSSCGDDYNTKTKYRGAEKTLGDVLDCCEYQIRDMVLIDHLNPEVTFNLIKSLIAAHITEVDMLDENA